MGVPSLYRWLTMRFPNILAHLKVDYDYQVDNLYLDFNAIIHPCTDKEMDDLDALDADLYKKLERYIDSLVAYIKPRRMIYISVDGVAPKAKMNQQRCRRFEGGKTVFENRQAPLAEDVKYASPSLKFVFDPCAITPGTQFMDRLDIFVTELIQFKLSTDTRWKNKTVIYSNYKVPGEGEQKIMEYLRLHKKNVSESHVIYSPDADMIFLGLTVPDMNVRIMREEVKYDREKIDKDTVKNYMENHYVLVNIYKLKCQIIERIRKELGISFDEKRLLADFVFLCFTVGNDFLPTSPSFEIRANALEKILTFITTNYKKTRDYTTQTDGNVNFQVLQSWFAIAEKSEDENLNDKRMAIAKNRKRVNLEFDEEIEFPLTSQDGKIRYYMEKMNIRNEAELTTACKEYVKGMLWIYKYYFFGVTSWDYYYPYYFAPFMVDLKELTIDSLEFPPSKPIRAYEQLLAVLPAWSMHLLPASYRKYYYERKMLSLKEEYQNDKFLVDNPTGFIDEFNGVYNQIPSPELSLKDVFNFYDLNFKIDCFQKAMDWQFLPIIKFIDNEDILAYSKKVQSELTFEEADRNAVGTYTYFTNKSKVTDRFKDINKKPFEVLSEKEYCGKIYPLIKSVAVGESVSGKHFSFINQTLVFNFDQRYKKNLRKK